MKRFVFILTTFSLFFSQVCLPFTAQKKGIVVNAVDYGRSPEALCIEAEVGEQVESQIGKGITGDVFMKGGMRPVGIYITNTTDQPIMLAPAYSLKVVNGPGMIKVLRSLQGDMSLDIGAAVSGGVSGYFALVFLLLGVADRYDRSLYFAWGGLFGTVSISSFAYLIWKSTLSGKFVAAMTEKFEELNFKDEALILPGQTIKRLLLTQNEAYISRFPLVLYPLANRDDMIVFDIDLRK